MDATGSAVGADAGSGATESVVCCVNTGTEVLVVAVEEEEEELLDEAEAVIVAGCSSG